MLFVNIIVFIDRKNFNVATINFLALKIKRFANIKEQKSSFMMRHISYEL